MRGNARGLAVLAVGFTCLGLLAGGLVLGRIPRPARPLASSPTEPATEPAVPLPVTDPEVLRERETAGLERARQAVMREMVATRPETPPPPSLRTLPDGSLETVDARLRQTYAADGITLSLKDALLRLTLRDLRIGGVPVAPERLLKGVLPRVAQRPSETAVYERGPVREEYSPSANATEQVFVLDKSLEPLRIGGDLTITVTLHTALEAVPRAHVEDAPEGKVVRDTIEFRQANGDVLYTYGAATAIDAEGRTRVLSYALRDGAIEMNLDAEFLAKAVFPLTIDPLVGSNFAIDNGTGEDSLPDVAYNPFIDAYLVVYERSMGTVNGDIYCAVVNSSGTVSGADTPIASASGDNSRSPKVASTVGSNQFLVVWSNKAPVSSRNEILCQRVTVSGAPLLPAALGGIIQIPDNTVRNADDSRLHPDVGFCTDVGYYLVAWEEIWTSTTDRDVWVCRVSTAGVAGDAFYVDFDTDWAEFPTVPSKAPNPMGFAYRKTVGLSQGGTGNGDIYGASVDVANQYDLGFSAISADAKNETDTHLSSDSNGVTYLVWARERVAGGDYDIMGRRINWSTGALGSLFTVEGTSSNTTRPHCDAATNASNIPRLIVTYTIGDDVHAKVYNTQTDPPSLLETLVISNAAGSQNNATVAFQTDAATLPALVTFDGVPLITLDVLGQRVTTVVNPPVITSPASLANGTQGTPYGPVNFTASGDLPITWSVTAGTLPSGLTLTSAGVYSGTPSQAGTYNFTVTASNGGGSNSRAYTHVINPGPPVITGPASPFPPGYVGYAYGPTAFTSSGTPPITWTTTGTLPTGITLSSTGSYSGTPTVANTYNFNATATNVAGSDTDPYVHEIRTPTAPTNIQPITPLTNGLVNTAYSVQFTAEGSPPATITWSVSAGSLPPGITLTAVGLYSGTPTTAGTYNFTIRAANLQGNTDVPCMHLIAQPPAITSPPAGAIAPNGLEEDAYAGFTFAATGYPAPTWSVAAGTIPPGITLNPATGQYSGTPTTPGTYGFTVTAANSAGSDSRSYTHVIDAKPRIGLSATALVFEVPEGGPNPAPQTVTIANIGGFLFNWTVSESGAQAANVNEAPAGGRLTAGQSQPMVVSVDVGALTAGSYVVTLSIAAPEAINNPRDITVTINVNNTPELALSKTSLTIDAPEGGPDPAPQRVTVSNVGTGSFAWTATDDAAWLSVVPTTAVTLSAGASDDLYVLVDTTGLAAGSYGGTITVTAPGATGSPATIAVTLNVNGTPKIAVDPDSLTFDAPLNGPDPAPLGATVTNAGAGTLSWSASWNAAWLGVAPASGALGPGASRALTMSADVAGLAAGTYVTRVVIGAPGATARQITVTLSVNGATPRIGVGLASLTFDVPFNSVTPVSQSVTVSNVGGGTLAWTSANDVTWLTQNPVSNLAPGLGAGQSQTAEITVSPLLLAAGTYRGLVTVSDAGASNSPQTVAVTLNVNSAARVGVSATALTFNAITGGSPAGQAVVVSNTGDGTLNWMATPSESWIGVSAPSGTLAAGASATLTVSVSGAGLTPGTHTGTVIVGGAASSSPRLIFVTFDVSPLVFEEKKFGYCGSVGLDLMLPLLLLWALRWMPARRRKKGDRS